MSDSESDEDDRFTLLHEPSIFARKVDVTISKPSLSVVAAPLSDVSSQPQVTSFSVSGISSKRDKEASARQQMKLATAERKQREKLIKAQKREEAKREREKRKLDEKESRKQCAEQHQQSSGKYAHKEIAVLIDPHLFQDEELALTSVLKEDFQIHEYPSALTIPRAIQWVRKDYVMGGAKAAIDELENNQNDKFEHFDRVILILQPEEFIPLLQRSDNDNDDDDDYPALEGWLAGLVGRWQSVWRTTKQPKLVLLLLRIPETLDRQWVEYRRRKGKDTTQVPPTEAELQDAIRWILIQNQVECILCPSIEAVQANVHKLTRALSEAPYASQVTELECIKKLKANTPENVDASSYTLEVARDTWLRQLQQIPGVSEGIASNIVKDFPTALSLWKEYKDHSRQEGLQLAAASMHSTKRYNKLSEALYRFFHSDDPNEFLF